MLTTNDLRRVAARSGARDIGNVEIDIILTYLLQLLADWGITEHRSARAAGSRPTSISRAGRRSTLMT